MQYTPHSFTPSSDKRTDSSPPSLAYASGTHIDKATYRYPPQLKFKTQTCKYWLQDLHCPFQENCNFAHGKLDQRNKNYLPTKYKTRPCRKFNEDGYCSYGPRSSILSPSTALQCLSSDSQRFFSFLEEKQRLQGRPNRLPFFEWICEQNKKEGSTNAGTLSQEDRIDEQEYMVLHSEVVRSRQGSC